VPNARGSSVLRVGCSGWSYESWRHDVYDDAPASRWLERYARLFDTVEVNSSFYRLPTKKAVQAWVDATPERFSFAVKASRYLTHVRRLRDVAEGVERLYARIQPLVEAGKLGPVLWQLPATFRRNDDRLASALAEIPKGLHCFEFRDPSWFVDDVYDLLESHGVALVLGDHPQRPFQPVRMTAPWTYVRFHYGHRGRRGNYSRGELLEWAARICSWQVPTWAYFNNDWEAFAVENAQTLARTVASRNRGRSRSASQGLPVSAAG